MINISVTQDNQTWDFSLENRLRFVLGKRLVYNGVWQDKKVIFKFFLDSSHGIRHWNREHSGNRFLAEKKMRTPKIFFSGVVKTRASSGELPAFTTVPVIISEYIENSDSLQELWDKSHFIEKKSLLNLSIKTMAQLHEKGLVQEDLHLGNFLIADKAMYCIDGDGIKKSETSLSREKSLERIALLYTQFLAVYDDFTMQSLADYCALRKFDFHENMIVTVCALRDKFREIRVRKRLKKIFRTCSEILVEESAKNYTAVMREYHSEEMQKFLKNPNAFFPEKTDEFLKNGNTCSVVKVKIHEKYFVVKRYNMKNLTHQISRAFRKSRAAISWENAHRLLSYGIKTAAPVALIENRLGPLRSTAWFVMEFIEGEDCCDFFCSENHMKKQKTAIAKTIIELFKLMKRLQLIHGDMKATNIIVADMDVHLIDLDSLRIADSATFEKFHQQDILRFMKNWENKEEINNLFKNLSSEINE